MLHNECVTIQQSTDDMQPLRDRAATTSSLVLLGLVCAIAATGVLVSSYLRDDTPSAAEEQSPTESTEEATERSVANQTFAITVRKPLGPPRVGTGQFDRDGNEITVSCATCHATRKPNFANKSLRDLNEFHKTLEFNHGKISCLSCHNANDYDALKLADGSRVEHVDVMSLCAQCHGQQMKDYEHGAHGGMRGYWDLSRGPREKNNCVDCHNPHSPQFPKMEPTFKPRDRFLNPDEHDEHGNVDSPNSASTPANSDSTGHTQ